MFGAVARAAGGFAGAMLVATIFMGAMGPLQQEIARGMGKNNVIYQSLDVFVQWFPFFAFLGVIVTLIARGIVESQLPG